MKCATELWLKANARIHGAADMEDTKSVYGGIRKAVEPTKNLTSPCYQKPDKSFI